MKKIGILSGTFDPVHAGHIAFALDAVDVAQLDEVYFLPEPKPRRKQGVTHYAHRIAMLRLALKPYKKLKLLELPDKQFSVAKSMPKLQKKFAGQKLYMLIGSDMMEYLATDQWPQTDRLLKATTLVVGVRSGALEDVISSTLHLLQPEGVVVVSKRPHASSRDIRSALMNGKDHAELMQSIRSYVKANWLYSSVLANNS